MTNFRGFGPPARFLPLPPKLSYTAMFFMMKVVLKGHHYELHIESSGFGKWRLSNMSYDGPEASSPIAAIKAAWKDIQDPYTEILSMDGGGYVHTISWNGRTWQMSANQHNCYNCSENYEQKLIKARLELEKFLNPTPAVPE